MTKNTVLSLAATAALAVALAAPTGAAAQTSSTAGASGSGATAKSAAPARAAKSKAETGAPRADSSGRSAMRERQKKCGAEWREAKSADKVEKGMKWPQFWSACNKRLKAST